MRLHLHCPRHKNTFSLFFKKKLKEENNFYKNVTNIQRILKKWKMRKLTLEAKIVIFKTIAISKIVF